MEHINLLKNLTTRQSTFTPNLITQKTLSNIYPITIENRLNSLSFNENIFNEAATHYQKALKNSGYQHKFSFQNKNENATKATLKNR